MLSLKPRGFWDYASVALFMTGVLALIFWMEALANGGFGWSDVAFALASGVLVVLVIIIARQGEKAKWIARPGWQIYLVATLGAFVLIAGAVYADAYFLHHTQITGARLRHDLPGFIIFLAGALWSTRKQFRQASALNGSHGL